MTLAELGERMTQEEFNGWCDFFVDFPFDDRHRYHRPAALVAAVGMGKTTDEATALRWLDPGGEDRAIPEGLSEADATTLTTFRKLMKGRG